MQQFWIARSGVVCMLWWDLHVAADAEMRDGARKCHIPPLLIYRHAAATGTFDAHRDGIWHPHSHRRSNLLWITRWEEKKKRGRGGGCLARLVLFTPQLIACLLNSTWQMPGRTPSSSLTALRTPTLSAKPGRVFCLIFLHSLVSEHAPDFLILPSLFLMSFSFSPPTGVFPITSESSHLWNLTHFLPADLVLFPPVPPNTPIRFRGRPKLHCEYKKEKKRSSARTCLSKMLFFCFLQLKNWKRDSFKGEFQERRAT